MINKTKLSKLKLAVADKRENNQVSNFFDSKNLREDEKEKSILKQSTIESKVKHLLKKTESVLDITEEENYINVEIGMPVENNETNCKNENPNSEIRRNTVVSKFFNRSCEDFETLDNKSNMKKSIKEKLITTKRSSNRKKKQTTIKSAFAKNEEIFSELVAQHSIADNFNPDEMQLALACSISEIEPYSLNSESNDSVTCNVENSDKIREKLQQFGFKSKCNNEDIKYFLPKSKNKAKWANRFTPLTHRCPQKQNQKLNEKIEKFLNSQFDDSETCDEPPFQFDISSSYLKELIPEIDTIKYFRNCSYINKETDDIEIFYVTEIFEPKKSKPGSLLKNFRNIPGRERSPKIKDINIKKVAQEEVTFQKIKNYSKEIQPVQCVETMHNNDEVPNVEEKINNIENSVLSPDHNKSSKRSQSFNENNLENSSECKRLKMNSMNLIENEKNFANRAASPDIFYFSDEYSEKSAEKNTSTESERINFFEKFSSDEVKVSKLTKLDESVKSNKSNIELNEMIDLTQSDESLSEKDYEKGKYEESYIISSDHKNNDATFSMHTRVNDIYETSFNYNTRADTYKTYLYDDNVTDKEKYDKLIIERSTEKIFSVESSDNQINIEKNSFRTLPISEIVDNKSKNLNNCLESKDRFKLKISTSNNEKIKNLSNTENVVASEFSLSLQNILNESYIILSDDEDVQLLEKKENFHDTLNSKKESLKPDISDLNSDDDKNINDQDSYSDGICIALSDDDLNTIEKITTENFGNQKNLIQTINDTKLKNESISKNISSNKEHMENALNDSGKSIEKELSMSQASDSSNSCIILSDDEVNYSIINSAKKCIKTTEENIKKSLKEINECEYSQNKKEETFILNFLVGNETNTNNATNLKHEIKNDSQLQLLEENLSDLSDLESKSSPKKSMSIPRNNSFKTPSPIKWMSNDELNRSNLNENSFIISDIEDEAFDLNKLRRKYGLSSTKKNAIFRNSTGCRKSLSESFSKLDTEIYNFQRSKTITSNEKILKKNYEKKTPKESFNRKNINEIVELEEFDEFDKLIYGSPVKNQSFINGKPNNFEKLLTAKINEISPEKSNENSGCRKSLSESFSKLDAEMYNFKRSKTITPSKKILKKNYEMKTPKESVNQTNINEIVKLEEFDEFDKLIYGSPIKNQSFINGKPNNFEKLLTAKINEISPIKSSENSLEPFEFENDGKVYLIKMHNIPEKPDFERMDSPTRLKELYKLGLKPLKRKQAIIMLEHIYNQTHPIILHKTNSDIEIENKCIEDLNFCDNFTTEDDRFQNAKTVESDILKINKLNLKDYFWEELDSCDKLAFDEEDDTYIFQTNITKKVSTALLPFHIAWYNLVKSNTQLRESILHFEPIDLQEIYLFFKSIGYRYDPKQIKKFLDAKCIVFRYDLGLNNGNNRHVRKKSQFKRSSIIK